MEGDRIWIGRDGRRYRARITYRGRRIGAPGTALLAIAELDGEWSGAVVVDVSVSLAGMGREELEAMLGWARYRAPRRRATSTG